MYLLKQEQPAQEKKKLSRWAVHRRASGKVTDLLPEEIEMHALHQRGEKLTAASMAQECPSGASGAACSEHTAQCWVCFAMDLAAPGCLCLSTQGGVGESRVVLKFWNQQMMGPELYASGTQDSASWWCVSPDGLCEGYGERQRRKLSGLAGKKREGQETAMRPKHYLYARVLRVYRFTYVNSRGCCWCGIWWSPAWTLHHVSHDLSSQLPSWNIANNSEDEDFLFIFILQLPCIICCLQ